MNNAHPKLVLPTVETCPWRTGSKSAGHFHCGLISKLTGISEADSSLTIVSEDACGACCRSFPPSVRRLNPVVASLLYSAAGRIIDIGGVPECPVSDARRLRAKAEESLVLIHDDRDRLIPARSVMPCFCFGERLNGNDRALLPLSKVPGSATCP